MPGLKIRVLTGCQMDGLVCALRVLFPTADVEGFHTYRLLGSDRVDIEADVRTADLLFVLPLEAKFGEFAFRRIKTLGPKIQFVPHVVFAAFHPDLTYAERSDGSRIQTPMTDYNSLIAIAAYRAGCDAEQTLRLFNAYTYQALGYFSHLATSQASVLADFAFHGIDLREPLARWLRHPDPFMYSSNHPKAFVLADIALAASRAAGLEHEGAADFGDLPDHLGRWVVWPVFKEIAARLGKTGGESFKLIGAGDESRMTLGEFVARSFDAYAKEDMSRLVVSPRIAAAQSTLARLTGRSLVAAKAPALVCERKPPMVFSSPQTGQRIEDCFFYHTTDLPGHGTQLGSWDLRGRFSDYIGGVDLTGRRVLDVGAASGFLSFSAEEAGAREVVSFDLDSADRQNLLPFAGSEYVTDHPNWSLKQTASFQRWKNAYWLTHRLKKSEAKAVYGDVYALPEAIGRFDVVILGAILEHLADPIRALASIAEVARDTIVINTDYIDTDEPLARFNGRPDRPDASYVFWTYSIPTYDHIMGILGFEIVSMRKSPFRAKRSDNVWLDQDRVALVCRRKDLQLAPAALRRVA